MKKVCIFCGQKPIEKNKEHIIPKWLIEMTGNPKRVANLCKDGEKIISFAWQSYTFPACEECNSNFSDLESKTKDIIFKLLNDKPVSHKEFNIFLDWLDKVRIGIWLGNLMLLKKTIEPKFYINQRVGNKDRVCVLYKVDDNEKGIGIIGTHTKIFEMSPSCFGLIINNLAIFNYSKELILSKNMGFPYLKEYHYNEHGNLLLDEIISGSNMISYPIIDGLLYKPAIRLYQTIISPRQEIFKRPNFGAAYNYYKKNCYQFSKKIIKSRIYIVDENSDLECFWNDKTMYRFKFAERFDRMLIIYFILHMVLEQQNRFIQIDRDLYQVDDENNKKQYNDYFNYLISWNQPELNELKSLLEPVTKRV